MSQIEFVYEGTKTIIQCNSDEKFEDILKRFSLKTNINLDSVYFLYSGNSIENKELTFHEMANNIDKERKQMNIQILDKANKEGGNNNQNNSIVKSKDIICPECGEICFISINDYKIRLYNCINEHDIDKIDLDEYNNTQQIDTAKIICNECEIKNKYNSYKNYFYRCNNCKKNLCPLCKEKHDKTHNIIDYEDKNYICTLHNYPYTLYCKSCELNLCITCEMKHDKNMN